ncbi:MAG TPA: hypothetical protein VMV69_11740 [Pirellulales bacterium]|nr:hypothetical protein [Pirellulales bacterium]
MILNLSNPSLRTGKGNVALEVRRKTRRRCGRARNPTECRSAQGNEHGCTDCNADVHRAAFGRDPGEQGGHIERLDDARHPGVRPLSRHANDKDQ